jgi:hypothetical protein
VWAAPSSDGATYALWSEDSPVLLVAVKTAVIEPTQRRSSSQPGFAVRQSVVADRRHCCIKRSAQPTCSTRPPRSHAVGPQMSVLSRFFRVPEGPASPLCCMARTPFAFMQQCPRESGG